MSEHTKGPWFVGEPDKNGQAIVRNADIEIATCWHHCVGAIEKEMHANARLMATSPELLDALKEITDNYVQFVGENAYSVIMARRAIAKAEVQ